MELVHLTNYWGQYIDPTDNDHDVDFVAIWVQCTQGGRPCCPGYGRRRVLVDDDDLLNVHSGYWSLFLVKQNRGDSNGHYFYKLVLIPQGTYGYGKKGCKERGWTYWGEVPAEDATNELYDLVCGYMHDDTRDFNHIHIGIWWSGRLYAGTGHSQ